MSAPCGASLKVLSVLLHYPSEELRQAVPDMRAALCSEGVLDGDRLQALEVLFDELLTRDLYALEETYVSLFDRSRGLSLDLFEHVHGESRDRGGAMVDLLETYRAGGFEPCGPDLPDHLPILLEFLSLQPPHEARATLADAGHIIAALGARLGERGSVYAAVFDALVDIAGVQAAAAQGEPLTSDDAPDPDDLAALDADWEDSEVRFAPPAVGCNPTAQGDVSARSIPIVFDTRRTQA